MSINLSATQQSVMKWVGKGWTAYPAGGTALTVNGKRICNLSTMVVLARLGLVEVDEDKCWNATEAGRSLAQEMQL